MKIEGRKPIIAMDLSTQGQGGGPYMSTIRIMSSSLSNKYNFVKINYDPLMGRGISVRRILDLRRQITKLRPDIVHFTGLSLSGFHLAVACFLSGITRTVVTIHGTSTDAIDFHPIKKIILAKILEPFTLLISKKIVGVSDFVTFTKIGKMFRYKIFGTIYNFPPEYEQILSKDEYRKKLLLGSSDIVISSIGRINKEKGYHIFEETIKYFSNNKSIKFVIVGDGGYLYEMRKNLISQVESGQVIFLGHQDDVKSINFAADIFVLPTLHETLSIALLEASTAGLALVASDTGGVPEIVETNHNGLLVPPGDSKALVNAIKKLVDNPLLIKKYGNNALLKVNNKFSKKNAEKKLELLYSQLLSS